MYGREIEELLERAKKLEALREELTKQPQFNEALDKKFRHELVKVRYKANRLDQLSNRGRL